MLVFCLVVVHFCCWVRWKLLFGRGTEEVLLTIVFDLAQLYALKRAHPDWVLLLGDKSKNPSRLVGAWKDLTSQSMEDLEALVARVES